MRATFVIHFCVFLRGVELILKSLCDILLQICIPSLLFIARHVKNNPCYKCQVNCVCLSKYCEICEEVIKDCMKLVFVSCNCVLSKHAIVIVDILFLVEFRVGRAMKSAPPVRWMNQTLLQ